MSSKVFDLIEKENIRQKEHIELIASENFVSEDILKATGSILTNKYAEGYPKKRYYGGCQFIDEIEQYAIDLAKQLFHAQHANVQPHSGSQANTAAYAALLEPGDKVLGMSLNSGGHLTHGHPMNFSGKLYQFYGYDVQRDTETLDYQAILKLAQEIKPKLIVAGASAYSHEINFKKFKEIADAVGAYFMVDMAHIAGLVAAGYHQSPIPYADIVTTTTHKTLRGPRSGLILCKSEFAKKVDSAVFPGNQGGPLEHIIAAKAICFEEALTPEYREYIKNVVDNCKVLSDELEKLGFKIVSKTTQNHLVLIDTMTTFGLNGKLVEQKLGEVNITVNKNMIPFDTQKPIHTSGIRLGTAAMTTRGFDAQDFKQVAHWIYEIVHHIDDEVVFNKVKNEILDRLKKGK